VIVADANLLLYLVLHGTRTEVARSVMAKDAAWAAPPLWSSEVISALARWVRRAEVAFDDALAMYSGAAEAIGGREFDAEVRDVLTLAASSGCTGYDCEYVAVAQMLGVQLVTADKQVLGAFPRIAVAPEQFVKGRAR